MKAGASKEGRAFSFPMNSISLLQTVYNNGPNLLDEVRTFIANGADLNRVTEYSESALRVASNNGRFDVVRLLLDSGADFNQLGWSSTMLKVVGDTLESVRQSATQYGDLEEVDFWSRTPFLIAVQLGDIDKASALLELGANRDAAGRCGKTVLQYAAQMNHIAMLNWLIDLGCDVDAVDEFGDTALMMAASCGHAAALALLIERGADMYATNSIPERALERATTLETVRMLVALGDDINVISPEMHAALLGTEHDGEPECSQDNSLAGYEPVFGTCNPTTIDSAYRTAMIRSNASAWRARKKFSSDARGPVWCYRRYGRTTNMLDDGTIVEIGGEHEDHYDPDFCIYNDVTVFDGKGGIRLFGYPKDVFPPTDFHSATQVGNAILIIGCLGYGQQRRPGHTPVYRLDLTTFKISPVETSGTLPGWISNHRALLDEGGNIVVSGGKVIVGSGKDEDYVDNSERYSLQLATMTWSRV
jgi:ankyrin repeat protein